jgi:hypothetical protein
MTKALVVGVVVLLTAGFASAATLQVMSKTIDPGPNQEVLIVARGPELVGGVNLNVQIGDGGELVGGTDVAGMTVPGIQTIDFRANGAIWGSDAALVEEPGLLSPLVSFGGFGLNAGNKQLPNVADGGGVVATLILDASGAGVAGRTFQIRLDPFDVPSDLGGVPTVIVAGEITVLPEPASALLLLTFAPLLRRRR